MEGENDADSRAKPQGFWSLAQFLRWNAPSKNTRGGVSTPKEERSSGHKSVLDRILDQFCVGAEVEVFHDSVFMKLHRPS